MAQSPSCVVCKPTWAKLFKKAWDMAMTPTNARKGFQFTGIFPLNQYAIPSRAFEPASVYSISSGHVSAAAGSPSATPQVVATGSTPATPQDVTAGFPSATPQDVAATSKSNHTFNSYVDIENDTRLFLKETVKIQFTFKLLLIIVTYRGKKSYNNII